MKYQMWRDLTRNNDVFIGIPGFLGMDLTVGWFRHLPK
jgi:hypothetical protein